MTLERTKPSWQSSVHSWRTFSSKSAQILLDSCGRQRDESSGREDILKTFVIGPTCDIRAHSSDVNARVPAGGAKFATQDDLTALAENWSGAQLVQIWNNLPGVRPVRKFRDRGTAVRRIWRALQGLEPPKSERVITLLTAPSGATLADLIAATGWQPHSVRGFISAQLVKRLGFRIKSVKQNGQRVYRIIVKSAQKSPRRKESA